MTHDWRRQMSRCLGRGREALNRELDARAIDDIEMDRAALCNDLDDIVAYIISAMKDPAKGRPGRAGLDLTEHESALRELMLDARHIYMIKLDRLETLSDPANPQKRLGEEERGEGLEDWDKFWQRHYYRGSGNSGWSRDDQRLPIAPLHQVYELVRRWWLRHINPRGFDTVFVPHKGEYNPDNFNNAAYFLTLFVQEVISNMYRPRHLFGLHRASKRRRSE